MCWSVSCDEDPTHTNTAVSHLYPGGAVRLTPNDIRSVKGVYGQSPNLLLETGQPAIDFTLYDYPDGNAWNLREELEAGGKPVVLIWGMFTCPAFQGMGDKPPIPPWDKCGYRDEYDMVRRGMARRAGRGGVVVRVV